LGSDLADANAAYVEAYEAAQELVIDMIRTRRNAISHRFDVCDEDGRLVFELPFSEVLGEERAPAPPALANVARGHALASEVAREVVSTRRMLRQLEKVIKSAPG